MFRSRGSSKGKKWAGFSAIGLVKTIPHGRAQQIAATLRKGGHKESGGLDVGDCVFARVVAGRSARAFFVERLAEGSASNKFQLRSWPHVAVTKPSFA